MIHPALLLALAAVGSFDVFCALQGASSIFLFIGGLFWGLAFGTAFQK
jgi:hypothetical protein